MQNNLLHEIELYPPEIFKTIVDHEVNRSRRYGDSLTLVDMVVETEPIDAQVQQRAELVTIHALAVQLRQADIPCKRGNEFLILMPATGQAGARTACERLRRLMNGEPEMQDDGSFKLSTFIGMASLPNDRSLSSKGLIENAARALEHARTNRLTRVMTFAEINE